MPTRCRLSSSVYHGGREIHDFMALSATKHSPPLCLTSVCSCCLLIGGRRESNSSEQRFGLTAKCGWCDFTSRTAIPMATPAMMTALSSISRIMLRKQPSTACEGGGGHKIKKCQVVQVCKIFSERKMTRWHTEAAASSSEHEDIVLLQQWSG